MIFLADGKLVDDQPNTPTTDDARFQEGQP
jgi:hypothetical protein